MPVSLEEGLPPKPLWPERIYTLPEHRYPVRLNVARELLDANAEGGRAGRPAIYAQDQVLTYGELQKRVNRLANGLRAAGIDRGDRMLLRMPNCPEFIVTWLACQKLGVIAVLHRERRRHDRRRGVERPPGGAREGPGAGPRARAPDRRRRDAPGRHGMGGPHGWPAGALSRRRHGRPRRRDDRLHLGLDGRAQGMRAPAHRHPRLGGLLRALRPHALRGGPVRRPPDARLHLRDRRPPGLPAPVRGGHRPLGPVRAIEHARDDPAPPDHRRLLCADLLPAHARGA
ncbi:MAG: AMP-binding protein [Candidatus Rokubacteria bacterium]|nr:AMP-binding protein [Candidatus Rokubacteria bacterium]